VPFGVTRVCYSAPVKTFADGERTNRIIWYRVPDEREFYEGESTFSPRVDDMFQPSGQEYELTGRIPNPRRYYSGKDIWHKEGVAVDGDEEDFLGLALTEKYVIGGVPPVDPCDAPTVAVHLLQLGQVVTKIPGRIRLENERLLVGHRIIPTVYPSPPYPNGVMVGHVVRDVGGLLPFARHGLMFAHGGTSMNQFNTSMWHGLAVRESVPVAHPSSETNGLEVAHDLAAGAHHNAFFHAGLLLGLHVNVEPQEPPVIDFGLLIGEPTDDLYKAMWTFPAALLLGDVAIQKPPQDPPIYHEGLEIGLDVIEPAGEGPHDTCETALLVDFEEDFGGEIEAMEVQWFQLSAPGSSLHRIQLTGLDGLLPTYLIFLEGTCPMTVDWPLDPSDEDCHEFTSPASGLPYIAVRGNFAGPGTYVIRWAVGACPFP